MSKKNKLSTQPYKGVRDFYPEDMYVQNYIFDTWRVAALRFGYKEYNASLLEPSELYEAKTSEEIVQEQMYSFEDRGGRRVSLRPEMTPTVARLVARKEKEYTFPLRWFSLPNVFRYEKPQRGRLREHTQLNVDIFGSPSIEAEAELIELSHFMMQSFNASSNMFTIKINSRKILKSIYERYNLSSESEFTLMRTLDKKEKLSQDAFRDAVAFILGGKTDEFLSLIHSTPSLIETLTEKNEGIADVTYLIQELESRGITNIQFDPSLTRGFDYYTGVVFEIFDTSGKNNRSLFGGGRYSELVESFGKDHIEAVGFGVGDVVLRDFLETHELLPSYVSSVAIALCRINQTPEITKAAHNLASFLRSHNCNVIVDISDKNVSDQITRASKQNIPYVICIGDTEVQENTYTIKHLPTGEEHTLKAEEIPSHINTCDE